MRSIRTNEKLKTVLSISGFVILLTILGMFYLKRASSSEERYLAGARPAPTDSIPDGLKVDPAFCTRASTPDPAENSHLAFPDSSMGGRSVKSGHFTFELWVICDPAFGNNPPDAEHSSNIAGLGIWFTWRYDGPAIEGTTETYWGVEPEVQKRGEYQGDLTSGTSTEAVTGIKIPAGLRDKTLMGETPLIFTLKVRTPRGEIYGSSLSFTLQSQPNGLEPINIQTVSFEKTTQTRLAVPTVLTPPSNYVPPAPAGTPPPANFDPSGSSLDIRIHMAGDLNNPSSFYGDIYAGDYLLGRVDLGYSPARWCDRSEDGSRLAFVYFSSPETGESHKLRWIDLRAGMEVVDPIPDLEIMSGISWSPVGYQLAFFACDAEGICGLYLMDTDTNTLSLITDQVMGYLQLFWKPDGKELAFYATGAGGEKFYIIDVNSGEIIFTADRDIALQTPGSPIQEWGVKFTEGKDCFDEYLGVLYP